MSCSRLKSFLWAFVTLASLLSAHGQGSFSNPTNLGAYINGACEIPSNESTYAGEGIFSYNLLTYNPLSNTVVTCRVILPLGLSPTRAGIYGPAASAQTAPLLFDLGQPQIVTNVFCVSSWPNGEICSTDVVFSCSSAFSLSPRQMKELGSGAWYVNVLSSAYPAGEIRGQINAIVLGQPRFQDGSNFTFKVTAGPNRDYQIETSTNLTSWFQLTNVNTTNSLFQIVDPHAANSPRRFYRVKVL